MEGFVYVVNPPVKPKVAFGSGLDRETLPMSGPNLSSFMRAIQGEIRDFPGPHDHCHFITLEKDFPSKKGYSAFASKIPRLPPLYLSQFPPIGAYDIQKPYPYKQYPKPFGSGAKRLQEDKFLTPGPPTYPYHYQLPKFKVSLGFGTKRRIMDVVTIFCSPTNKIKCQLCGMTPVGDFWHCFTTNLDVCRTCMNTEEKLIKHCETDLNYRTIRRRELSKYVRARYCGFYHAHNGTNAALQIISKKTLRFKVDKENYLYQFQKRF